MYSSEVKGNFATDFGSCGIESAGISICDSHPIALPCKCTSCPLHAPHLTHSLPMALSVQEEDENALVMASLVLNKKAGFIDKKNVMEILKTVLTVAVLKCCSPAPSEE